MFYEEINPDLRMLVGKDEKIMWYGKPDKKCFLLEGIFNPLLPFALIWVLFDGFFLFMIFSHPEQVKNSPGAIGIFLFFLLHLMPVWIYLFGCLTVFSRYKSIGYIVTDKAVYRSKGIISKKFERKAFSEFSSADINVGIIDKLIGVGDIVLTCKTGDPAKVVVNGRRFDNDFSICDIREYREIYKMIKDLQAQADVNSQQASAFAATTANYDVEYFKSYGNNQNYAQQANYAEESMRRIEKNNNIANLIKTFAIFVFVLIFIMFFVSFIAQLKLIPKEFSPIHLSFHKEFGNKKNTSNNKLNLEKLAKQDIKEAENLYINKIISEVKNYQLMEGLTIEEKIRLLYFNTYKTLKWEAKQSQFDLTYYVITVSLPESSGNYDNVIYRFNYNTVSYMAEATTAETNRFMTVPYLELIKDNQK